ncbi:uncharacterized protein LOC141717245 [Apium graveolens]|uniref:uncharacterized protein LOC141717245 n=1 Tax=Apium graveolens TaxID=4045 RepID=UPI003D78DB30
MHCSNCRQPGHRVSKCPTKNTDATPEQTKEKDAATETRKKKDTQGAPVKKKAKEVARQKLAVRRPTNGITINAPQTQGSQTGSKHPKGKKDTYKGKGKQLVEEDEGSLDDDSDASDRVAEEVWKLFEDDYFQGNEGSQKKMKLVTEVEAQEDAQMVELGDDEPLASFKKIPRKKMSLVKGQNADQWSNSGKDYVRFSDELRGPVGTKVVFMPTPGLVPFRPPRATPPTNTPPPKPEQRPRAAAAPRSYGFRLSTELKRLSGFKNTAEDPINLGE